MATLHKAAWATRPLCNRPPARQNVSTRNSSRSSRSNLRSPWKFHPATESQTQRQQRNFLSYSNTNVPELSSIQSILLRKARRSLSRRISDVETGHLLVDNQEQQDSVAKEVRKPSVLQKSQSSRIRHFWIFWTLCRTSLTFFDTIQLWTA